MGRAGALAVHTAVGQTHPVKLAGIPKKGLFNHAKAHFTGVGGLLAPRLSEAVGLARIDHRKAKRLVIAIGVGKTVGVSTATGFQVALSESARRGTRRSTTGLNTELGTGLLHAQLSTTAVKTDGFADPGLALVV